MTGPFEASVARFASVSLDRIDKIVRKIALDLHRNLVLRSPVDTGRFRANNQIVLNSLPSDALMEFDKSGTATISKGTAKIASINLGDTIFFFNNVAYALELEFGHSKQAPQGVYRLTVMELMSHLRSATKAEDFLRA